MSQVTLEEFVTTGCRNNPWVQLPGWHPEVIYNDWLHVCDLALFPEACASVPLVVKLNTPCCHHKVLMDLCEADVIWQGGMFMYGGNLIRRSALRGKCRRPAAYGLHAVRGRLPAEQHPFLGDVLLLGVLCFPSGNRGQVYSVHHGCNACEGLQMLMASLGSSCTVNLASTIRPWPKNTSMQQWDPQLSETCFIWSLQESVVLAKFLMGATVAVASRNPDCELDQTLSCKFCSYTLGVRLRAALCVNMVAMRDAMSKCKGPVLPWEDVTRLQEPCHLQKCGV